MSSRISNSARTALGGTTLLIALLAWNIGVDSPDASPAPTTSAAAVSSALQAAKGREVVILARPKPVFRTFAPGASPYLTSPGARESSIDVAQLKTDLAGTGKEIDREISRIVGLARFKDRIDTLAQMLPNLSQDEAHDEAYEILGQLPKHVANGEILPGEALAQTRALIQVGEAAPNVREELTRRLTEVIQQHAVQVVGPAPASEPQFQRYARERDQMVQDVLSQPNAPEEQQRQITQRDLEIRERLY